MSAARGREPANTLVDQAAVNDAKLNKLYELQFSFFAEAIEKLGKDISGIYDELKQLRSEAVQQHFDTTRRVDEHSLYLKLLKWVLAVTVGSIIGNVISVIIFLANVV